MYRMGETLPHSTEHKQPIESLVRPNEAPCVNVELISQWLVVHDMQCGLCAVQGLTQPSDGHFILHHTPLCALYQA